MVAPEEITTSAPGSLMLLGEHAVLHGHRALVCAINRRITVRLAPNSEGLLRIDSALGHYAAAIDELADHKSFRFILQAIKPYDVPSGFDLKVNSEFSAEIGFGSSAAVTVATHAALMRWLGEPVDKERLFARALETVHAVQGRGSGADLAAAVFGGIVAYSTEPSFDPVPISVPLTAVYCGYKTPTPEVIQTVEKLRAADPATYERIYAEMDAYAVEAADALHHDNLLAFGSILNRNQRLMDQMGVNTPELQQIVTALQQDAGIVGAKISGSGMGDCAVGIGHAELDALGYPVYHLDITPEGCRNHE